MKQSHLENIAQDIKIILFYYRLTKFPLFFKLMVMKYWSNNLKKLEF